MAWRGVSESRMQKGTWIEAVGSDVKFLIAVLIWSLIEMNRRVGCASLKQYFRI